MPCVRSSSCALKPMASRYTAAQREFLAQLYDWPERLNEEQAHRKFNARFAADDGPYACSLRLDRAHIKAWLSSEKQRRQKQGALALSER